MNFENSRWQRIFTKKLWMQIADATNLSLGTEPIVSNHQGDTLVFVHATGVEGIEAEVPEDSSKRLSVGPVPRQIARQVSGDRSPGRRQTLGYGGSPGMTFYPTGDCIVGDQTLWRDLAIILL